MRYSYEFKRKCVELYWSGQWPETPDGAWRVHLEKMQMGQKCYSIKRIKNYPCRNDLHWLCRPYQESPEALLHWKME